MTSTTLPTFWFAAPNPIVGSANTLPAAQQFDSLFTPAAAAAWPTAAGQPSVIMLSLTFVLQASTAELQQIVTYINAHGLKLALSAGVVPYGANGAGVDVEGYVDQRTLTTAALKIQSLGGKIDILDMDDPLHAGHEELGNTSQDSITALAQQVASSIALIRAVFPAVQVGDNEPSGSVGDIAQWAAAFKLATGSPLAYIHADVDPSAANVLATLQAFAVATRGAGVSFGLLVDGAYSDKSDASWTLDAIKMMAAAAANPLIAPDQYVTVSWNAYPDQLLPAGLTGTLAHVALEASAVIPLYQSGLLAGDPGGAVSIAGPTAAEIPVALNAVAGASVGVPGLVLSVSTTVSTTAQFAVVLTDVSGTFTASASGTGTVTGSGTGAMTLTGTLAGINAELASVSYGAASTGADTIDVTAYDGQGLVGNLQITVATASLAADYAVPAGQNAAQAQSTITTLLQQLGSLAPTTASIAQWTAVLLSGTPLATIRATLANSAAVVTELTSIVAGVTGAAPSAANLAALQNLLMQGQTMAQISASLLAGSPVQVQLQSLYVQMLGTAPAAATLGKITLAYVTGASLASIRTGIATSASPTSALSTMYNFVYGQAATPAQLAAMQNQMIAGASLQQVEAQLDAVARANIVAVYAQTLDRAPTAQQLTTDASRIEAGVSMSGVRAINVFTTEEQNNVVAAYKAAAGVAPPSTTVTIMQDMIQNGMSLDGVTADVATVVSLYGQVLGATASSASIAAFLDQMGSGATATDIRAMMVGSPLAYSTVVAAYTKDFGHGPNVTPVPSMLAQLMTESMTALLGSLAQQAAADIPTMAGMPTIEAVTDNGRLTPLQSLVIGDPGANTGELVTATVKLASPIASFSNPWGGSVSADGMTFTTVTAAPSMIQQFLQALVIYPKAETTDVSTSVQITLTNQAGNSVTSAIGLTVESAKSPTVTNFVYDPASNDSLTATTLPDMFVISSPKFGLDTISGFDVVHDMINLPSNAFANFAAVQHMMSSTAAGTVITLDAQDTLTLAGVAAAGLSAKNFSFT